MNAQFLAWLMMLSTENWLLAVTAVWIGLDSHLHAQQQPAVSHSCCWGSASLSASSIQSLLQSCLSLAKKMPLQ